MKIYTKKGDSGETSLLGGERVKKYNAQIDAYGTIDELNSWIGLVRDQEIEKNIKEQLIEIQDRLFTMGSILAVSSKGTTMNLPSINESDVTFLEDLIDQMNEGLPEMRSFVLPGGHTVVSYTHICRCVCRRAERLIVSLELHSQYLIILKYLNRLSDYLFVLSRKLTQDLNVVEIPWKPRV